MCTFQGPAISTCATHDTPDVRTGRREGAAPQDLHIGSCSYANLVLGSLMVLPDDAFRRLSARWAWPDLPADRHRSSNCVLAAPECMRTACRAAHMPGSTASRDTTQSGAGSMAALQRPRSGLLCTTEDMG